MAVTVATIETVTVVAVAVAVHDLDNSSFAAASG